MEKSEVFTAKTVDEAIEAGLAELGLTREEVKIEIIEEGKKKLFGSVPAQVRLTALSKQSDGERAVDFLKGLFELLGSDAVPTLEEEAERIVINLAAETPAKMLIGRRGEVIDAVQTLAGAVANTGRKEYKRVVVDCGNYREDREETLKHVAEKLAAKAVRLGKRVRLEPMNPYERRIIHAALVDNPDVTTKSEGKEPARFVVIIPKNLRNDRKERDRGFGGRGGKYNDRKGGRGYDRKGYGEKKPYPKRELPAEDTPQSSGTSLNRNSSGGYKKGGFSGYFGTFLGNSRDESEGVETVEPETTESEE